jgi:hypothetical protein
MPSKVEVIQVKANPRKVLVGEQVFNLIDSDLFLQFEVRHDICIVIIPGRLSCVRAGPNSVSHQAESRSFEARGCFKRDVELLSFNGWTTAAPGSRLLVLRAMENTAA